MLKKVTAEITSKLLALKSKMRAIETRLIIVSLMLRDKKGLYHLFRQARISKIDEDGKDDYQSDYLATLIHNPDAATSITIEEDISNGENKMATIEAKDNQMEEEMAIEEKDDNQMEEDRSLSVIEMVKIAKEGQGKEFQLEDDIDRVADLFIQRFHEQIRLQKLQPNSPLSYLSV